jgi:hypothetical protein
MKHVAHDEIILVQMCVAEKFTGGRFRIEGFRRLGKEVTIGDAQTLLKTR